MKTPCVFHVSNVSFEIWTRRVSVVWKWQRCFMALRTTSPPHLERRQGLFLRRTWCCECFQDFERGSSCEVSALVNCGASFNGGGVLIRPLSCCCGDRNRPLVETAQQPEPRFHQFIFNKCFKEGPKTFKLILVLRMSVHYILPLYGSNGNKYSSSNQFCHPDIIKKRVLVYLLHHCYEYRWVLWVQRTIWRNLEVYSICFLHWLSGDLWFCLLQASVKGLLSVLCHFPHSVNCVLGLFLACMVFEFDFTSLLTLFLIVSDIPGCSSWTHPLRTNHAWSQCFRCFLHVLGHQSGPP